MQLHNNKDLKILGELNIENKQHFIVSLNNPVYINDMLVSYVVLPNWYFNKE